jgi:glycosyltransferase involved in cell wall biosynthesis
VLPQALIAGRPIVSFDVDGAKEVCIDDETGFLVPARATDRLAEVLVRLCRDSDLRTRLGRQGQERFSGQFCHRHMTERIREVYEMVRKLPNLGR